MNVYLENVAVAILVLLVCFSSNSHFVFADSSTQLGSRYRVSEDEVNASRNIAATIANYSCIAGFSTFNWYGGLTGVFNIYSAAAGVGDPPSIAFYIGHGYREGWLRPSWYILEDSGVWEAHDDQIFYHSSGGEVRFAFLWSCSLGDEIGGEDWMGPYGMPYAWLHNSSLSEDGYANASLGGDRAFLGFHNDAPYLSYFTDCYDFLQRFYFYALCRGGDYSINQALDRASREVYLVTSFAQTYLYEGFSLAHIDPLTGQPDSYVRGQMKVYGDGDMHLSLSRPGAAMKTKTRGCPWLLYVPSSTVITTNFLKLEMLFDNQNLTGDQARSTSPYPAVENYPDGKVDGKDLGLVGGKFGSYEGRSDWDYMADIFPDRKIDGKDLGAVNENFGKNGTYIAPINDQSGVSVIFNTGQQESPDANGFVPIPADATNFNVTRNGTPIGAMAIFWLSLPLHFWLSGPP